MHAGNMGNRMNRMKTQEMKTSNITVNVIAIDINNKFEEKKYSFFFLITTNIDDEQ